MSFLVEDWPGMWLGAQRKKGTVVADSRHFFFLHFPGARARWKPGFSSAKTLPSFLGQMVGHME